MSTQRRGSARNHGRDLPSALANGQSISNLCTSRRREFFRLMGGNCDGNVEGLLLLDETLMNT